MRGFLVDIAVIARRAGLLVLCLMVVPLSLAAEPASSAASPAYDFTKPKLLTGTLYAVGSDRKKVLFAFRRTATRSGSTVHVERQFFQTNGTLAAVDEVLYQSNRVVSYRMQEFQAHVSGAVRIAPDPKDPARKQIFISYGPGLNPPKGEAQELQPDTVFDDTVYPFMLAHWNELMQGDTVIFRLVSFEHKRTYEFQMEKIGKFVQNGHSVVQIKMKPASIFIAAFVDPIIFTVEKSSPHRVFSYIGRTTPRIRKGNSWKYLDAETVFNYPTKQDATSRRSEIPSSADVANEAQLKTANK